VSYGAVVRELDGRQMPPSWRQAVVSDAGKEGAVMSGKIEVLNRIKDKTARGGNWRSASVGRPLGHPEGLEPAAQTVVDADKQR
jgi:hypothetical protein